MSYFDRGIISALPDDLAKMTLKDMLEWSAVKLLFLENIGGVVYVARGEGRWHALHKIGRTINLPQRTTALQKRFGDTLRFSHAIWTDDPDWLEGQLHRLFARWHYPMPRGAGTEWFELSWEHVRWLRQMEAVDTEFMKGCLGDRHFTLETNNIRAPLTDGMDMFYG